MLLFFRMQISALMNLLRYSQQDLTLTKMIGVKVRKIRSCFRIKSPLRDTAENTGKVYI